MTNSEMSAETVDDKSGADDNTTSSHSSANTFVGGCPSLSEHVIEFNAWDKYTKKYLSWSEIKQLRSYVGLHATPINEPITMLNWDKYIWLENTRLLDKEKDKIFRGDILNYKKLNHNLKWINENVYVDWATYCYCLFKKDGSYFNVLDRVNQGIIKRIGNIFQNPELLGTVK